ncbi:hypothetical protein OAN27_02765 [Pelagibacteraceae bacterium]|nr:hypothetical protein [Pelagibacteraceae bacterium]
MQHKFTSQTTLKQTLLRTFIKLLLAGIAFSLVIFFLDKFNFPSPGKAIKKDITNEINKLK